MEKHYTFLKSGRVENTFVFAEKDDDLAQRICDEQNCDSFIWLDEAEVPVRWSTYNGITFTPPTLDYLYEIGISNENTAMMEKRLAGNTET